MNEDVQRVVDDVRALLKTDTDVLDNEMQRLEQKAAVEEHARLVAENGGRWVTNPPEFTDKCDRCGSWFPLEKIRHLGPFDYCFACVDAISVMSSGVPASIR